MMFDQIKHDFENSSCIMNAGRGQSWHGIAVLSFLHCVQQHIPPAQFAPTSVLILTTGTTTNRNYRR